MITYQNSPAIQEAMKRALQSEIDGIKRKFLEKALEELKIEITEAMARFAIRLESRDVDHGMRKALEIVLDIREEK